MNTIKQNIKKERAYYTGIGKFILIELCNGEIKAYYDGLGFVNKEMQWLSEREIKLNFKEWLDKPKSGDIEHYAKTLEAIKHQWNKDANTQQYILEQWELAGKEKALIVLHTGEAISKLILGVD